MQCTTLVDDTDESEAKIRIWSRDQRLEIVWEYPTDGDGHLVDTRIRRLRTEIEVVLSDPAITRVVRGLGDELVA
ncbi:MAG: helix-turn-helix domain-containing protein [Ilumatobacteraceae bacterium]